MKTSEIDFKTIVRENRERIFRICCYYAGNKEDREDLFQQILINVWNNLGSFREQSRLSTWIYRVAINTALDHVRKEGRRNVREGARLPDHLSGMEALVEDDDPGREQAITDLRYSLNLLPVMDKAIMTLVLEERSSKEIAEIIGITESNVRVKIHRIKETLKQILIDRQDGNR